MKGGMFGGLPAWSVAVPIAAGAMLAVTWGSSPGWLLLSCSSVAMIAGVLVAVHHAEVIALRVGEPFGTLVLALAVTVIETSLIVSIMIADPVRSAALPRDTVFSAVMI